MGLFKGEASGHQLYTNCTSYAAFGVQLADEEAEGSKGKPWINRLPGTRLIDLKVGTVTVLEYYWCKRN